MRITDPTSALDRRVRRYRLSLLAVALTVLAAAAIVGLGELDARAPVDEGPHEMRRLATEVNRTTAKLAGLLRSQEQFVADASHQLRTPLSAHPPSARERRDGRRAARG